MAGVPSGPVLTYDRTLENEQVRAQGMVREAEHPVIGSMRILGSPMALSETSPAFRSPAPWLGQHADDTPCELGLANAEIARLSADGVVCDQRGAKE